MKFKYCNSLSEYSRFLTREVRIGNVPLGGENPIRIQSMTNTPTMDTKATIEQCVRIIHAGADYVRITAPGIQDAENLANIKSGLRKLGYTTPIIADIHFNPKAAIAAASIVEKVRINPGNYADKKTFEKIDYTESDYQLELERIYSRLLPLLNVCKDNGTAIRIGVNHGSLSDRIMSRYGDTPRGMVESAMEFLHICRSESFHNIVLSLKASNTRIMVQAYRLLVASMIAEDMNYPLHLGVTEAGDGEDGRIKSAVGIGSLLADGIGDTIRVSLTEDPEAEIPVAKEIVKYFTGRKSTQVIPDISTQLKNPFEYQKRNTVPVKNIGGNNQPVVINDWSKEMDKHSFNKVLPDYFYLKNAQDIESLPSNFNYILNLHDWIRHAKNKSHFFPLYTDAEFSYYGPKNPTLNFVIISNTDISGKVLNAIHSAENTVLIVETFNLNGIADQRAFFFRLLESGINLPVIINRNYTEDTSVGLQIKAACDIGHLLLDGFGDGIWTRNAGSIDDSQICTLSFAILQASRVRTTKTEYISCPSCGRTLFDLQATTAKIKSRTGHLKHLKIGIMGCIVNGPGEMADADYGYVGAAPGHVTLYKGKEVIKRNIKSDFAVDELITLIKENGDWREPD